MQILITGGTGFIGAELAKFLAANGYLVSIATREKNTANPNSLISAHHIPDISATTNWQKALFGCNVVIHTAARAHILNEKESDPLTAFRKINVAGTINLAQQAVLAGVKRFIFISSVGVHGNETKQTPFTELSALTPHADYAVSKLEAEHSLRKLAKETNMEIVIIRPPLVYAANAPGNFQRLIKYISQERPLPLRNVQNKRSFIARQNLIHFIETCIIHPKARNETFLISDGEDISTDQLVRILADGMKKKAFLIPAPIPLIKFFCTLLGRQSIYQQLYCSLQIDSSKAQKLLHWHPPFSVTEMLYQTGLEY